MSLRESNVCKSPSWSPMESKHQKLYKMGTPPWKETYRKKCKERLTESRRCLLEKMRMGGVAADTLVSSVEKVLATEFNNLKTSQLGQSLEGDETDELLKMLEEVREELMLEERRAIEECMRGEGWMRVEEGMDEWMEEEEEEEEEGEMASREFEASQKSIVCPVCLKNSLTLSFNIVQCECGLRIDTEQDALSLPMIERNLLHSSEAHSTLCGHPPSFSLFQQASLTNLLMSCKECDYLHVVI